MRTSKKVSGKVKMTAKEFDQAFERGEEVKALNLESVAVRAPMQRINLDLPKPVLRRIDNEANRIGVPRTSLIKLWIAEKLGDI